MTDDDVTSGAPALPAWTGRRFGSLNGQVRSGDDRAFPSRAGLRGMRGLTLIELAVVLLIMIALAGVLVPMFQGTGQYAQCLATDATLANIRDAIMGVGSQAGFRNDMGRMPPLDSTNVPPDASSLSALFNNPGVPAFNPVTQRGWRGPYLSGGMPCIKMAEALNEKAVSSLPDFDHFKICITHSGTDFVAADPKRVVALDSFPVKRWDTGDAILPGSPIALLCDELDDNGRCVGHYFLASGGPDSAIGAMPATGQTPSNIANRDQVQSARDDRLLFLDSADPGRNQPCTP